MSPKILLVINHYRQYDKQMYEVLVKSFDLTVLWINPFYETDPLPSELKDRLKYEILRADHLPIQPTHLLSNLRLLARVVKLGRNVDLIICSTSESWKAKPTFVAAKLLRKPIAFRKERWFDLENIQNWYKKHYWKFQLKLTHYIQRHSAGMLVGGVKAKEHLLIEGVSVEKIHPFHYLPPDLIEFPLDEDIVAELRRLKGDELLFLYLGRIMPQKGLKELIVTFKRLLACGHNAKLLVVGEPQKIAVATIDYFHGCQTLADNEPKIIFYGSAVPSQVHNFYYAADVFVHPHVNNVEGRELGEGYGNTITEAASMGRAIITTDRVASAYDIIVDGENGFILDSTDLEDALFNAFCFCAEQSDILVDFGRNSRSRYEEAVVPERNALSIQAIINDLNKK